MNKFMQPLRSVYEEAPIKSLCEIAVEVYDIDPTDMSKEELIDEMMSIEESNYFK